MTKISSKRKCNKVLEKNLASMYLVININTCIFRKIHRQNAPMSEHTDVEGKQEIITIKTR